METHPIVHDKRDLPGNNYRDPDTRKLYDDDATRRRFYRHGLLTKVWQDE